VCVNLVLLRKQSRISLALTSTVAYRYLLHFEAVLTFSFIYIIFETHNSPRVGDHIFKNLAVLGRTCLPP
jgi:hypothetical protein